MLITDFDWPEGVADKVLAKHGLTVEEVEESFNYRGARVERIRGDRYVLLSRTKDGAYIFAVFQQSSPRTATIVTARPMTRSERRYYARG